MLVNRVERGRYLDSVALMRVSRRLESLAGVEDLGGVLDESSKLSSAGTFSAAAAAGLGVGGVNDKSLRAQLDSADYLRQLVQMGKRNRLVFG